MYTLAVVEAIAAGGVMVVVGTVSWAAFLISMVVEIIGRSIVAGASVAADSKEPEGSNSGSDDCGQAEEQYLKQKENVEFWRQRSKDLAKQGTAAGVTMIALIAASVIAAIAAVAFGWLAPALVVAAAAAAAAAVAAKGAVTELDARHKAALAKLQSAEKLLERDRDLVRRLCG